MRKHRSFNAALCFSLLVVLSGCSTAKPPQTTSESPQSNNPPPPVEQSRTNNNITPPRVSLTVPPDNPDSTTNAQVLQYVRSLSTSSQSQGVWMQSGNTLLANHQGMVPLQAASISKVATTLVALQTLGPEHRFVTQIGATGPIENGVLKGDLVIQGGEDPFFVWEEGIAVGNLLNQMGIKRVSGDLVIVGKFYMNYKTNPQTAGNLLKTALNSQIWTAEATNQYRTLPAGTPKPQVVIAGALKVLSSQTSNLKPLVRHNSYPLAELLKKMNQYSNNQMADMLANTVGGAKEVATKAVEITGVSPTEIQLINGSGLTYENRISPRAAIAMFKAIENYLQPYQMTVADVFTVIGQDKGILEVRSLPRYGVVKSGSLDNVSALVGALPTEKQGTVWFAIMNSQGNLEKFRSQQEALLNRFVNQWGTVKQPPAELTPNPARKNNISSSEIVLSSSSGS
ncbi:MAG: D-alanyl-D-alanine carboxypeptidase [Nostocaceae cyanobacterium]|nr:D-alanyl-D-alanine carboxypeptidase [Nostocaceae cyanobacterium]